MKPIDLTALRRILIIKPSSLGDVATAMPMLVDLHQAVPKAHIDWLIHPSLMDLLKGHQAIRTLIPFDRKNLAGWYYKPAAAKKLKALISKLHQADYDCVIDAQGLFRSAFFAWMTGAKYRIGFANAREGAALFYTHKIKIPAATTAAPQVSTTRMRALLEPLGIDASSKAHAHIHVQSAAAQKIRELYNTIAGGSARPVIIIPGARWETKRWPADRFVEIANRLLAEGHSLTFLGSPDEKPLCDEIISKITNPSSSNASKVLNLAGQTTMAEMIAALSYARLVFGNDSGPLHVAVALNKPVVGIYGPTDPNFVGPYGQLDRVARFDVECHPCRRRRCDHHSCMNKLTVEMVWQKIKQVLS